LSRSKRSGESAAEEVIVMSEAIREEVEEFLKEKKLVKITD